MSSPNPDLEKNHDAVTDDLPVPSAPPATIPERLSGISPINVRHNFIRKVYYILFTQLVLTVVIGLPFLLLPRDDVLSFIVSNFWLLPVSIIFAVLCISIANSSLKLLTSVPHNYIILFLLSCGFGLFFGILSCMFAPPTITAAIATLAAVILCLTIFAVQTTRNYSDSSIPYWIAFLVNVAGFVIVLFFFGVKEMLGVKIIAAMLSLMFSFYFVFETNRIVTRESPKFNDFDTGDYATAALLLYTDIIQYIMMALRCFQPKREYDGRPHHQ
jgi:FtsH-binding integral membrane protein